METKKINFSMEDEMSVNNSLFGFVPDSALIDASVMQCTQEGCFVDIPTPNPSVYYF